MWISPLTNSQLVRKFLHMSVKILTYVVLGVFSLLISFGFKEIYPFWNSFAIIFPIFTMLGYFFHQKKKKDEEIVQPYLELIEEQENALAERGNVISEYENILDTQFISLECDCKKGNFEGFFKKGEDNFVKCENCGNNYRLLVDYQLILQAEPLDNNKIFQDLKTVE